MTRGFDARVCLTEWRAGDHLVDQAGGGAGRAIPDERSMLDRGDWDAGARKAAAAEPRLVAF